MSDKVFTVRLTRHQMQALHGVLESQPHLSPELREIDDRLFNHLYQNQMNEKMYVVKVGDAYVQAYCSTRQIRLSKNFDDAYRFRTYHSANRIADIFGGEALRVGAYSLMFINAEDNK